MKKIAILLLVLTMFLLVSCGSSADAPLGEQSEAGSKLTLQAGYLSYLSSDYVSEDMTDGTAAEKTAVDISKVNPNLTLGEALSLFGKPLPNERNSDYPLVYSWDVNGEEVLYMVFEKPDRGEFWDKIKNGAYILPEETPQYDSSGLRFVTDNELKAIREWVTSHTPVCAYTVRNGEQTILFDLKNNAE